MFTCLSCGRFSFGAFSSAQNVLSGSITRRSGAELRLIHLTLRTSPLGLWPCPQGIFQLLIRALENTHTVFRGCIFSEVYSDSSYICPKVWCLICSVCGTPKFSLIQNCFPFPLNKIRIDWVTYCLFSFFCFWINQGVGNKRYTSVGVLLLGINTVCVFKIFILRGRVYSIWIVCEIVRSVQAIKQLDNQIYSPLLPESLNGVEYVFFHLHQNRNR